MTATDSTPWSALLGGALIGFPAVLLMGLFGRIAGISGIAVRMLPPYLDRHASGRWAFVPGLVAAPAAWLAAIDAWPAATFEAAPATLPAAGLLVGLCPGPAFVALGAGCPEALLFVPAMLLGMVSARLLALRSLPAVPQAT